MEGKKEEQGENYRKFVVVCEEVAMMPQFSGMFPQNDYIRVIVPGGGVAFLVENIRSRDNFVSILRICAALNRGYSSGVTTELHVILLENCRCVRKVFDKSEMIRLSEIIGSLKGFFVEKLVAIPYFLHRDNTFDEGTRCVITIKESAPTIV